MRIGMIAAMAVEHDEMVRLLDAVRTEHHCGYDFTLGQLAQHEIVLMQCGIGKVNAAIGTMLLWQHFAPEVVVSTGCAGGIDPVLRVMDVVASQATVYHDVWCGEGNAYGQVQGLPPTFASDARLVEAAQRLGARLGAVGTATRPTALEANTAASAPNSTAPAPTRLHCGLIATGDKFITDKAELADIKAAFPAALAVDMESAAIAHTCHRMGVPFISFRIISDTPGVEAHWEQYQNFWDEMAHRSFDVTRQFLLELP